MGSRASQLRNRQQVQDSSTTNGITFSSDAANEIVNDASSNIKALKYEQNNNNNSNTNINNNHDNDDAELTHEALAHQKAALQAAAVTASESGDTQEANGNTTNGTPVLKGFSLQDRASNFAQRIRRSSSIKKLFPTFVAGRRKVSRESDDLMREFCSTFASVCLCCRGRERH